MTQLVEASPDLYGLIMYLSHPEDQHNPPSAYLDFQESPPLMRTRPLELLPFMEDKYPESNSVMDTSTQSHFGASEDSCGVEMLSPQPKRGADSTFAGIDLGSDRSSTCETMSGRGAECSPPSSTHFLTDTDFSTTNTLFASPPPVRSSSNLSSHAIYHPIFSPCLPSPAQTSDPVDLAGGYSASFLSVFGSEAEDFNARAVNESPDRFKMIDRLDSSTKERGENQGEFKEELLSNLKIDLSWLDDDDDQYERDRLRHLIGECIQILPPNEKEWQDVTVAAELRDGRHVVIYSDGGVQEVNLSSLLWRRSL